MSRTALQETTIRDFGGGWDLSDSDKALSGRYQTVSDNIVRGTDGHWRKRYGTKLFGDLRQGVETVQSTQTRSVITVNGSNVVKINKPAHGYTSGQHVTFVGWSASINGITAADILGIAFGIVVNDANNFSFVVRPTATASGSAFIDLSWQQDTHMLSGPTIFGRYYKQLLVVFGSNGEVAGIAANGTVTKLWDYNIANGLTLQPWGPCDRVSAEIVRGKLVAVNGRTNDKPIIYDGVTMNYMIDASTLSNGAIPRADFVIAAANYVILVSTEFGTTKLEIGAKNTVMTASREVSPADAVEIDVGMLTQTVDNTIYAANVIRSRVFLGFTDRSMLGTLGIYNTGIHEPDFNDNIAEFGSFSHAGTISLGNDLFSPGYNGVNSLSLSQQSGEFQPQTISDLIHPQMLKHFRRLSVTTLLNKSFAVWNSGAKSYMLFLPKYETTPLQLTPDPITVTNTLQPFSLAIVKMRNHSFDEGDYITIDTVTGITGVDAFAIMGNRRIRYVLDNDYFVIECGAYSAGINTAFGGSGVTITPINDSTVAYVYEYNARLKIRRWSRFIGLDAAWGTRSQLGSVFFGKNGKVFQYGNESNKFSADRIGEYDARAFANSFPYQAGFRVLDTTDGVVYQVAVGYNSPSSGTFAEARAAAPNNWVEYEGEPIDFALETAWSDFGTRQGNKELEFVGFDASGSAIFTFSVFGNGFYRHPESYAITPNRQLDFVADGAGGWGLGDQPFGGGRNTGLEFLHSMPVTGKLFKLRFEGSSIHPLQVNAVSLHYHVTKVMT